MTYLKDTPNFQNIHKVLIIKLRNLGDVVLSTATISVLKARYPHLKIDFLINEEGKQLVSGLNEINEVICYSRAASKKGFFAKLGCEFKLFSFVKKQGYDLVINLTEGDKGNYLALISKARYKVAQEGSRYQNFFTHLYKQVSIPRHRVEKDLDALRRLGIYPSDEEKKLLIVNDASQDAIIDEFLRSHHLDRFTILHPVSRWMYKSPQVKVFIDFLNQRKIPVVITGHTMGLEGEYIKKICAGSKYAIYFPTQGSMTCLTRLIARSSGIMTVDSLPLHIASALKKPTVCLFGPTSEYDWGPWQNEQAQVVSLKQPCRACYKDGCGGGKLSDCLEKITQGDLIQASLDVFQEGV